MTLEEYKNQYDLITIRYMDEKMKLAKKYALANSPYKIGDIVTDHCHSIKIEKISVELYVNKIPSCIYSGIELDKKGNPKKRQQNTKIWQSNMK